MAPRNNEDVNNAVDRIFPKTIGTGIKVDPDDPTFPWCDLIGLIQPDFTTPTTSPAMLTFQTGVKAYKYNTGDILHCIFHIPHDWLPDSDAEFHLHLGFNQAIAEGQTTHFVSTVTYGNRDGVFGTPKVLKDIRYTAPAGGDLAFVHPVVEVPLCRASTSPQIANELDRADIEVDGLVMISIIHDALNERTVVDNPFVFTADIHYQSTGVGTKNNASPFYS